MWAYTGRDGKRLGVTTPAVNKWENGNTNPDIELLAPIARLLHISLDTLLSFQEKLTDMEIETLIRQMGDKLEKEGFEKTYEWAGADHKKVSELQYADLADRSNA